MSNVNLKTCTKGDLKKSIKFVLNNAKENAYILLEDIYCNNPSLTYTKQLSRKHNAFGGVLSLMEGNK